MNKNIEEMSHSELKGLAISLAEKQKRPWPKKADFNLVDHVLGLLPYGAQLEMKFRVNGTPVMIATVFSYEPDIGYIGPTYEGRDEIGNMARAVLVAILKMAKAQGVLDD